MHQQTMLFTGDKSSPKDLKVGNVQKTSKFSVPSIKSDEFPVKDFSFQSDFIINRYLEYAQILC